MANDLSETNIYNLSAYFQCKLATAGAGIATKLAYKDLCDKDKVKFILAHIYKNIIQNYHANSCVSEEDMCTMVTFIKKYLNETSYSNNNCNCN